MRVTISKLSTVSASETAHFARLAARWWDETGELGLLHRMNPARIKFLKSRPGLSSIRSKSILDVGCGGGLFAETLARQGAKVTGIDAVNQSIKVAQVHASQDPMLESSLDYECTTTSDLVKDKAQYDIVCAMEVIEHVEKPALFLNELAALTKPGGHIIMSTISRTFLAKLLTITMAQDVLGIVTPGTHTFSKYIKPSELEHYFTNQLGWIPSSSPNVNQSTQTEPPPPKSETEHHLDNRFPSIHDKFEVRGVAYIPWKGTWELLPRQSESILGMSAWCNYFIGARKPLE